MSQRYELWHTSLVATADPLSVLLIALGLSADCFAVALSGSIAMRSVSLLQVARASLAFGFFQGVMPVLGWLAGRTIVDLLANYDHWVAFLLLAAVGGRMIWGGLRPREHRGQGTDITRGLLLVALSVATSIDAFAVGLSLAFVEVSIALASLTIGVVALVVSAAGFFLGRRADKVVGKRAEVIGGALLIGIALRILLSHML